MAPISSITGPYNIGQATLLAEQHLYVGKLVQDPQNDWVFLAFVEKDEHGSFGGYLINSRPVRWDGDVPTVDTDLECLPNDESDARASASTVAPPG